MDIKSMLPAFVFLFMIGGVFGHDEGDAEIVYQWNVIEYEWPNDTFKQDAINNGRYIKEQNAINGIKMYKDTIYVTVPRLKLGVPSTLNVIVNATSSESATSPILKPFPSWEMQTLGDCNALQLVQSMEIDPSTGYMWIIDTGDFLPRKNVTFLPLDACPAKLIIYDLNKREEVHRHEFPRNVVGPGLFYLNDIVLGFENGKARYAYISDTLAYKLVVYDYVQDTSYYYAHASMAADANYSSVTINNHTITLRTGINGLGMSSDFRYLYYSAVAGVGLYQIETSVLTSANGDAQKFANALRHIGDKISPGDGMVYSNKHHLFFSAFLPNAVYEWYVIDDLSSDANFNAVNIISQSELASHISMEWVDTLAISDDGYLWFTTSRLNKFFSAGGIAQDEPNFFVWRMHIGEGNYMTPVSGPTTGARGIAASIVSIVLCIAVYALS